MNGPEAHSCESLKRWSDMHSSTSHGWSRAASRRARLIVYLFILCVTTLLVLRVGAQTWILSLGREIREISSERATVESEIAGLNLRVAELRKGRRIKMIARNHLGMVVPVGAPRKLF